MSDLRFAFRQLLKNPGFTAVAVLTLGSGVSRRISDYRTLKPSNAASLEAFGSKLQKVSHVKIRAEAI